MQKIKVRMKAGREKRNELVIKHFAKKRLLENILYKGQRTIGFKMHDEKGVCFEVFNIRYDDKIYFILKVDEKVFKWYEI